MLGIAEHDNKPTPAMVTGPAPPRENLKWLQSILVVDDSHLDAVRTISLLRVIAGYDAAIVDVPSIAKALAEMRQDKPDLIFLDDILSRTERADVTIPMLRRFQYVGPIVVLTGFLTRERKRELLAAGAFDALCKDDVDGARIRDLLQELTKRRAPNPPPAAAD